MGKYKSRSEKLLVFVAIIVLMLGVSILPMFVPKAEAQSAGSSITCGAAPGGSVVYGAFGFDNWSTGPAVHLGDSIFAAARVQSHSQTPNHFTATVMLKDPNGVVVGSISKTFFLAYYQNGQFQLSVPLDCTWPVGTYTFCMSVTAGNGVCGVYSATPPAPVAMAKVVVSANGLCGL